MKTTDYQNIVSLAKSGDKVALRQKAKEIYYAAPLIYNENEAKWYDGRDALAVILSVIDSDRYEGKLSREVEDIVAEAFEPWM